MLRAANSCAWSRCFGRAKLRWKSYRAQGLLRGAAPQRELRNRRALEALLWNAGGTFADRPAELAHCAARVRLRARSLWLMSGMRGLSLEVTDLCVEPPSRECPL